MAVGRGVRGARAAGVRGGGSSEAVPELARRFASALRSNEHTGRRGGSRIDITDTPPMPQ